jgi:hypothetical protein
MHDLEKKKNNRPEGEEVGEEGDLQHGLDFECDVGLIMFRTLNVMLDL